MLGQGTPGVTVAEGYLKNVLFYKNDAGNYGGGLVFGGDAASCFLVGNVTFESNTARGGGAITIGSSKLISITDTKFLNNRHVPYSASCII